MASKIKTMYAVVCENPATGESYGVCGLFKNLDNARKACDFWCNGAVPDVTYNIHNITTDL